MKLKDMHVSDRLIKHMIVSEGVRYEPYDDGSGNMTTGIGHLIKEGEVLNHKLSEEEVYSLFREDVKEKEDIVKLYVNRDDITQGMFDVLVDMAYNLKSFPTCGVVKLVNKGKFDEARKKLLSYTKSFNKHKGIYVEMPGLVKRCKERYKMWVE